MPTNLDADADELLARLMCIRRDVDLALAQTHAALTPPTT